MSGDARFDRGGNLLGALSLALVDRVSGAIADATKLDANAAGAMSALHFFHVPPSIDMVRRVLGLTPSGAVRLVDRLEALGYVQRKPGPDARMTFVVLTAAGRRVAGRVARARAGELSGALSVLSARERTTLESLVGKVLVGMIREPGAVKWTCRLCDTDVCGRYAGWCPVGNAAAAKYA
jgi:DNA-binding MarR family transcriptional regulator